MKLLDLFSGIGGFSLGLERSGAFQTVAFCESSPFCRDVLKKHWPKVPCYEDVRTLDFSILRRDGIIVDAICGGFPCQDISGAAEGRAGLEGARSGLWFEYARLVGELRPKIVLIENVARLLNDGMRQILHDLAALGYDAEWHCIAASALGAPHRRERIWIVAHPSCAGLGRLHDARGQEPLQPASNDLRRHWAAEPALARVADGLPARLVRNPVEALGNAVVPQIPEIIGRAIAAALENGRAARCRLREEDRRFAAPSEE